MLIAREKLKTNIIEYVLYMFHIEDMLRANHFDMDELEMNIISKYSLPGAQQNEVRDWYKDLVSQMDKEDIKTEGHLKVVKEKIFQLNDLHIQLLNTLEETQYLEQYQWASEFIKELKEKMGHDELTEIEVCFNGLYGFMLLKMKGSQVTEETQQAMAVFSQILKYLAKKYHAQRASDFV